jgi:alpha-L-rhamnosidase
VIQWTFLSNVFSVQSDCPAREKMGYGADIVATAGAFIHNYNMANFYRKVVNDFANDQRPAGGMTEIAPSTGIADRGYGDSSGPLGWQLAFPYLQKQLYDYYGDKRIIEKYYPAFKKQMDFLQAKAIDGLYYWDIGDHESIDTKADAFAASCFYYHHALLAQEFAAILGNKDDSVKYEKLAGNIKNNIIGKYLVPGTGRFDNATQSPQIFALWYDLTPEKEKTLDVLLKEFQRKNDHLSTGIFSTMMMMDVLRDYDQGDFLYKIINQKDYPGWAYMLNNGGTTLWESWMGGPQVYSYNHPMFGSVDEWFYKSVLGIRSAAMAFKKIIIQPHPSELAWAKGSYQSMYGEVKVDWKKSSNSFSMNVAIPVNTTAEIYLPAAEKSNVFEKGKAVGTINDIHFLRKESGYNVYSVGSGDFDFTVKN